METQLDSLRKKTKTGLKNNGSMDGNNQLSELQTHYDVLYEHSPIGYITLDINGIICNINAIAASLLGIRKKSLLNKNLSRYIPLEFQSIFLEYQQQLCKGLDPNACVIKLHKRNGPAFFAKIDGRVIGEETKQLIFTVTDSVSFEELQDAQTCSPTEKRENSADLPSIVAHEISHPLSAIGNYIHGCINRLEQGTFETDKIIESLKKTTHQLNRISDIILHMKNFVYKNNLNYEYSCIDSIIKEAIFITKCEFINFHVVTHYTPNENIPNILLDKLNIQQVLVNLIRNGIEAIRDAKSSEPKITIEVNRLSKDLVEIGVQDNGPGFSTENSHRMFETHFTTKPYGIGLGLSVSRAIVESHGGKLEFEANPTGGSCFKFTLPIKHH